MNVVGLICQGSLSRLQGLSRGFKGVASIWRSRVLVSYLNYNASYKPIKTWLTLLRGFVCGL